MSKRVVPYRCFPPYAYLPGRYPHPVRDADGHSFQVEVRADPDELLWGADLFDAGYYWEAHEAWEPFWRAARRGSTECALLKALILLAAAALKRRDSKPTPALRHAHRALRELETIMDSEASTVVDAGRFLASRIRDVQWLTTSICRNLTARPVPVLDFAIRPLIDIAWP